jgi:hypothetical protein
MSEHTPQPRYAQKFKELAKRDSLALFTIDIDRRFLCKDGGRSTITGVCSKEHYPYLRMLLLILGGVEPKNAASVVGLPE